MRRSIRHPSDIPIEISVDESLGNDHDALNDVSFGGLSFRSHLYIKAGTRINIRISAVNPVFEAVVIVRWCRKRDGDYYDVGVAFCDPEDAFKTRMVEQVCHIEHYKREVLEKEGRQLTSEQAALEWIERYASKFPRLDTPESS